EPFQFLHDEGPDFGGRNLLLGPLLQHRFDAIGHLLDPADADGTFFARLQQPCNQFLTLEPFAAAILLDHHVGDLVDPLVAGEAAATVQALSTPPDDFALFA